MCVLCAGGNQDDGKAEEGEKMKNVRYTSDSPPPVSSIQRVCRLGVCVYMMATGFREEMSLSLRFFFNHRGLGFLSGNFEWGGVQALFVSLGY